MTKLGTVLQRFLDNYSGANRLVVFHGQAVALDIGTIPYDVSTRDRGTRVEVQMV